MARVSLDTECGSLTLEDTKITVVKDGEVVLHIVSITEDKAVRPNALRYKPGFQLSKGADEAIKAYFPKPDYLHLYNVLYGHTNKKKNQHEKPNHPTQFTANKLHDDTRSKNSPGVSHR